MKVLLISRSTSGGGAAHACMRLFHALRSIGVETRLLTLEPSAHEGIQGVADSLAKRLCARAYFVGERLEILAHNGANRQHLWRISTASLGFEVSRHPWVAWADVIHLHWINQGFLSLRTLRRLASLGKPIVWTLHDLWPATGGCHLPFVFSSTHLELCPAYELGCGYCPLLGSTRYPDLSSHTWARKIFLTGDPFHFIAVSRREAELLGHSRLMWQRRVAVIAPPLDLEFYSRDSSTTIPEWYDPRRQYLLIAASRLDDPTKGGELLHRAMSELIAKDPRTADRLTLLLVGEIKTRLWLESLSLDYRHLGVVHSPEAMRDLYRLADVTISTSLFETFGQTLSEALASGCPVVSFAAYGPEDIVRSGENGYLAKPYDPADFARKILMAVRILARREGIEQACRASVAHLASEQIALKHRQYYEQLGRRATASKTLLS